MCRGISPLAMYSIAIRPIFEVFLILRFLLFLLFFRAGDLLLVDEVGDLVCSLEEALSHLDEVQEVVDARVGLVL